MAFTGGPNNRPHNPMTFADVDSTQANITDGAFARGPFGAAAVDQVQVHLRRARVVRQHLLELRHALRRARKTFAARVLPELAEQLLADEAIAVAQRQQRGDRLHRAGDRPDPF